LLVMLGGVIAPNPPPASAVDISLESRSYLPARGIDGGDTHVLFYEYLTLDAANFGSSGLYVSAGGWGRADLADETFDRKTNGDLQYGYVGWRGPKMNAEARLGRVDVTAGVARNEIMDGALAGTDLPWGFDVTAFGGVPVETDSNGRSGDTIYGGRLSQGRAGLYRIGASYLKEDDDSSTAREQVGGDIVLTPVSLLEISGSSSYDLHDDGWAQHNYRAVIGPFAKRVLLRATWVQTDYDHYFTAVTNAAFDIEAHEKLDRLGGEVELTVGRGVSLTGEYVDYKYDVAEEAKAYGGHVDWAGGGRTAGLGYRKLDGEVAENRYQEFRGYVSTPVGPVAAAAGIEHLVFDEPVNGEKNATTGTLNLGYAISKVLEFSALGEYGVTPEFEHEARLMLALLWRYDAMTKKGGKP
jgi:hypothetical protein